MTINNAKKIAKRIDNRYNPFRRYYKFVIPSNLDLDTILINNKIDSSYHKKDPVLLRDYLYYIISLIITKGAFQKEDGNIEDVDGAYTKLCTQALKDVISNYKELLTYLEEQGVIDVSVSYKSGMRCRGYRLASQYRQADIETTRCFNPKLLKCLASHNQPKWTKEMYPHQYISLEKLSINKNKAYDFLSNSTIDPVKRLNQEALINNIHDGYVSTYKMGRTGRLYSTISNLKSGLRDFLTIDGQSLVEVDIKNCLPHISLVLFDPALALGLNDLLKERSMKLPSKVRYKGILQASLGNSRDFKETLYLLSKGEYSDVTTFRQDILHGDIYIKMASIWNEKLGTNYDRKTAKKAFNKCMYYPTSYNSKELMILAEEYPTVMGLFGELNGDYQTKSRQNYLKKKGLSFDDTASPLANYLQGLESYFVLDVVCDKISTEYPHVPFITLHDGIFTTSEYKGLIKSILEKESKKLFGVRCRVE